MNDPTRITRRGVLASIVGVLCATALTPDARAQKAEVASKSVASKVILLGTGGGPVVGGERRMSSNAIVVRDTAYLVDCGYGVTEMLVKVGIPLRTLQSVFITHNHADHNIEYGTLLFFAWLQGRADPIQVYGPDPLKHMTDLLLAANENTLRLYQEDMNMGPMPKVIVHEQSIAGLVIQDENVRVTCALVEHPPVIPSFAYRFDLPDRSIVFSGDTAPSEALVRLAKGADMLIHEASDMALTAAAAKAALSLQPSTSASAGLFGGQPGGFDLQRFIEHVHRAHSSAEDAGRIAAEARVRTLVLNHLSPGSSQVVSDSEWRTQAAKHFAGEIIVGHDGLTL